MDKEQKQIMLLVGLLVVIAGVLVYFNRQRFIPRPGAAVPLPPALPQLMFDTGERDELFGRQDFRDLEQYTAPVDRFNVGNVGNDEPFKTLTVEAAEQ